MNILVIGCGRVGISLAEKLDAQGHDVAIVDSDNDRFRALSDEFTGVTVCGMPMDMDVIQHAGVENCDAVAVVTSDDNLNITVSQIVKEFFGIDNVLARISDPTREKVFKKFGLKTVCPTNLAGDAMYIALTKPFESQNITFGASTVSFSCHAVEGNMIGQDVKNIPVYKDKTIFAVVHKDGSMHLHHLSHDKMTLKENDYIVYANLCD